jgi:glyoxylase I family protein
MMQNIAACKHPAALRETDGGRTFDGEGNMEKVTGIGGLFIRARDPEALARWYHQHLGVLPVPTNGDESTWEQQAGPTVFAPFPASTEYFGDPAKMWMINFRVSNLDAMVAQLRAAGITVEVNAEPDPNGRFARVYDPEGNPVELWQPEGCDASQ